MRARQACGRLEAGLGLLSFSASEAGFLQSHRV